MPEPVRQVLLRRSHALPTWVKLSRYTIGSAVCFVFSEVVFLVLFGSHLLGAGSAAVAASVAGIVPGYALNRRWTWGRRGRASFWRETAPYAAVALLSAALAAIVTGRVDRVVGSEPHAVRTVIGAAAFMAVYGFLFVGKYVFFQRWLFAGERRAEPLAEPVA